MKALVLLIFGMVLSQSAAPIVRPDGTTTAPSPGVTHRSMNYGPGRDSCGARLESARVVEASSRGQSVSADDVIEAARRRAFVSGYLTAAGDPVVMLHILGHAAEASGQAIEFPPTTPFRDTDGAGMYAAVSKFCAEHPTENIRRAAQAVLAELKRAR